MNRAVILKLIADEQSLRECKECPLLRIEDGKPTCMFTDEHLEEDCQILEIT